MKALFFGYLVLMGSYSHAGYLPAVDHSELCVFDAGDGDENLEKKWFTINFVDVLKVKSLSKFHLELVNIYVGQDEKVKGPMTLKEIQNKYRGSDLGLILLKSKKSGRQYVEVRAYPGDNPVGLIFDAHSGDLVASNNDGTYSIVTAEGERYCRRY